MSTTVTSHLRPGVYSVYEASSVVGRSPRRGWAGVVGLSEGGTPGKVYPLGTQAEAAQAFGKEDNLTQLVQVCMANGAARVLAAIPRECAVLETDCPYMAPEPVRGTRNDSRNIAHVADYIAGIWQMEPQAVLDLTAANARECFRIV